MTGKAEVRIVENAMSISMFLTFSRRRTLRSSRATSWQTLMYLGSGRTVSSLPLLQHSWDSRVHLNPVLPRLLHRLERSISSSSVEPGPLILLVSTSPPLICHSMSLLNAPVGLLVSSSYVPSSANCPSELMQMMRSERLMVERRCAMLMVVLFSNRSLLSAWLTRVSDSASRALVASSRMRMSGFFISARAMAMRCFWPPESCVPLAPT
jgi:hypothetical protein